MIFISGKQFYFMKYSVILPLLVVIVLLAGCTTPSVNETDNVTTSELTSVMTSVTDDNTTTSVEGTTTSTIKLGETCTDTDGGINYDARGEVKNPRAPTGLTSARDRCVNNATLNEYFCKEVTGQTYDYVIDSEQYKCPILCFNGACVEEIS